MASDSRTTVESPTINRTYNSGKITERNGDIIGVAGDNDLIEKFLKWYGSKKKRPQFPTNANFEALILTKTGELVYYDDTLSRDTLKHDYYAIGSGGDAARGAMAMGATPIKAVEIACTVDLYSGLPVQVIHRFINRFAPI